ncbi:MAG: sulfite exporter TauE/SafE family protein [Actinomycetota bacterium]
MDWTVYWFMLPVCVVVAGVAMFSGISGAALLTPVFLIGFPLIGVPTLTTVAAIGTSLLLETSGFGTGVYRYLKMRLVDTVTARLIVPIALPLGALGAVVSRHAPSQGLRLGYGVAMFGLAWVLFRERSRDPGAPVPGDAKGQERTIESADGRVFRYRASGLGLQRVLSGGGAFVAGLISTGVGEATLPPLVQRSGLPVPVAAATSTVIVASTVAGAAVTHAVQLVSEGGIGAVPWNLIAWAVPGALVGAQIGTRLQGRIPERAARLFFAGLFAVIGATFLLAFTVFVHQFA